MNTLLRRLFRRLGTPACALVVGLCMAGTAAASPETLKRSFSNILFSPLDFVLSPVTAGHGVYTGMRDIDDTTAVRVVYLIPGYAWNVGVHAGAASLRALAGLIELLPGIGLFFFDADLDPIYAPAERAEAFVDYDTPVLYVKFGINYTAPPTF